MTKNNASISYPPLFTPSVLLATWFGCGYIKKAPGTMGSLGAIPFGILFLYYGGIPALLCMIISMSLLGYWASDVFDRKTKTQDNKCIVIDEVVGMWIAMLLSNTNIILLAISFLLFRVFDILKPWPVSIFDKKIKGPIGVMGDDIIAGIMALLCIIGLSYVGIG